MSYREKSIELLNKAVAEELHAVHQYMYFHFRLEDAGYEPLAKLFHRISIVEMLHVEELAERILFLKGDVEMKISHPTQHIHQVKEMLKYAAKIEGVSVAEYNEWAKICAENGDAASKKLFESLVVVEEEHQDIFDTQLDNLEQFGDQLLALQAHEYSKSVAEK